MKPHGAHDHPYESPCTEMCSGYRTHAASCSSTPERQISLQPGNWLVTITADAAGVRVWNALSLSAEDTGADQGDPAALLGVYFAHLNTSTDIDIAEAFAADDLSGQQEEER